MTGRVQKVKLETSICYREKVLDFNDLLLCMLTSQPGSYGFIRYRVEGSGKTCNLKKISSGFMDSLKDIDAGICDLVIPSGTYYFEEYPDLSEEKILTGTLASILGTSGKDEIYVRLFKKNSLECVLQAFRPV